MFYLCHCLQAPVDFQQAVQIEVSTSGLNTMAYARMDWERERPSVHVQRHFVIQISRAEIIIINDGHSWSHGLEPGPGKLCFVMMTSGASPLQAHLSSPFLDRFSNIKNNTEC